MSYCSLNGLHVTGKTGRASAWVSLSPNAIQAMQNNVAGVISGPAAMTAHLETFSPIQWLPHGRQTTSRPGVCGFSPWVIVRGRCMSAGDNSKCLLLWKGVLNVPIDPFLLDAYQQLMTLKLSLPPPFN